jgi:hypothetical protein
MPCLLGCLALGAPRLVIILLVIFSDYIGRAFGNFLLPLLGFLFLPTTTLAYAWAINTHGVLEGGHLVVFVMAILIDVGILGGSARSPVWRRRERW